MNGYHEFYRATLVHKGIPLHTVSLWNTVILLIQTIMQHQYGKDFFNHCTKSFFSPTTYVVLFCALETVFLIGIHGWYIARVSRFNRATLPPDAFRGLSESLSSVRTFVSVFAAKRQFYPILTDFNSSCLKTLIFNSSCLSTLKVGVATRDAETNDLLEKQADLINYLKDHNNKLNQKLMTLNAQLRASSGSVSQQ